MNRHLASLFDKMRPRWDLSMAFDPEFILNNSPKLRGAIMELAIFTMMYVCIPNTELLWDRRPSVARINAWVENYISNEKEAIWSKGWFVFSDPKWGAKVRVAESTKSQGRWCCLCWEGCDCGHCHDTGSEVWGKWFKLKLWIAVSKIYWWWFLRCVLFWCSPQNHGEDDAIVTIYVSNGLVQPPPRCVKFRE